MKRSSNLILSTACLIYFVCLIYLSYKQIDLNNTFDAIAELITVPLITLTLFLLAFNIKNWYQEKFSIKSPAVIPIVILITALILMVVATIFDI